MTVRATWLANGSKLADSRLGIAALFAPAGSGGLAVRSGVLRPNPLAVVQESTASVNVRVPAFQAVVQSGASNIGGAFLVTEDAAEPVAVLAGAGQPANSPRNDLIVLATTPDTDATHANPASLTVLRGAPSATPVDPIVPAGALALARVRVRAAADYSGAPAVTNADIDQLAPYTGLAAPSVDPVPYFTAPLTTSQGVASGTETDVGIQNIPAVVLEGFTLQYASRTITYTGSRPVRMSVYAQVNWTANSTGGRRLSIYRNGALVLSVVNTNAGGYAQYQQVSGEISLSSGDVIKVVGNQSSGSNLPITGAVNQFNASFLRYE